jgi:hypothetical protein
MFITIGSQPAAGPEGGMWILLYPVSSTFMKSPFKKAYGGRRTLATEQRRSQTGLQPIGGERIGRGRSKERRSRDLCLCDIIPQSLETIQSVHYCFR